MTRNINEFESVSDYELRRKLGMSEAEFYDDPSLSWLTPEEEDEAERQAMEYYIFREERESDL